MNNGQGAQTIPFQSQAQGAGALGSIISQGIGNASQNLGSYFNGGSPSYFGSTQSPGNYSGSGYGGYGMGSAGNYYYNGGGGSYVGGGDSYGFTM